MKKLSYEDQEEQILKFLPESIRSIPTCTTERIHMLVPIIMERIEKFSDVASMAEAGELGFFFERPTLSKENLIFKDSSESEIKTNLEQERDILSGVASSDWDISMIKDSIMAFADTLPKRGPALHPLRYSLSGLVQSPDPFTIASIIGKEETLARIETAIGML